jgi:hypothetical protein
MNFRASQKDGDAVMRTRDDKWALIRLHSNQSVPADSVKQKDSLDTLDSL